LEVKLDNPPSSALGEIDTGRSGKQQKERSIKPYTKIVLGLFGCSVSR
jgi:hypothetical protein